MADYTNRFLFLFIIVIFNFLFFSHSHSLPPGVSIKDKGRKVDGKKAKKEHHHHFTYEADSEKGPKQWGEIVKICKTGKSQSPIDIVTRDVKPLPGLGRLKRNYKLAPAVLLNRGHDISVSWKGADAGSAVINGTSYKLIQSHWHTPSEHTLNGKRYNMELHMVHNTSSGNVAVISVLYKLGHPDPFLQQFLNQVKTVVTEQKLGDVHPINLKFGSSKYYRYQGSLTVPPCTQDVVWTIINKVRTVSREQLRALRDAVSDGFEENSRPTQPLNGRQVYLYRPAA